MAACGVRDDWAPLDRQTDRQLSHISLIRIGSGQYCCWHFSIHQNLCTCSERLHSADEVSCARSTSLFLWPLTVRGGNCVHKYFILKYMSSNKLGCLLCSSSGIYLDFSYIKYICLMFNKH